MKRAVRTGGVALRTDALVQIERDGDRHHVVLVGDVNQWGAVLWPEVGGINYGQVPKREARSRDISKRIKGGFGGGLIVGIIADGGTRSEEHTSELQSQS